jgi:hypothetical protein
MRATKLIITLSCIILSHTLIYAQVTGGQRAFEYLRMSNSPYVSALGGYTPAHNEKNVSLIWQNPSLFRSDMHQQLSLNYNIFYANIGIINGQYGFHSDKLNTDFGIGVQYINYGTIDQIDEHGISQGTGYATDHTIGFSASRQYKDNWRYGATLKWANSVLAGTNGMAMLADFGISYTDTINKITIGAVAKNIGVVLKKYNTSNTAEPLPFDLQLGLTKQLQNVPLRLFVVAHHLYRWDIRYDNPADIVKNAFDTDTSTKDKTYFTDKLFRHLNFGAELIFGKRVTASVAYSHIRRKENGFSDKMKMAGFSLGLSIELNKLQVRYGQTHYGSAGAYHELGFNFDLNKLIKKGQKVTYSHTESND